MNEHKIVAIGINVLIGMIAAGLFLLVLAFGEHTDQVAENTASVQIRQAARPDIAVTLDAQGRYMTGYDGMRK